MSHNQVICLVQHALDPLDVPLFVTSLETIKLSNGQFPNVVPFSVKKDIYDRFCCSEKATTRVDVVDMYDSDNIEVSQVEAKDVGMPKVPSNKNNHFQTLGKTPEEINERNKCLPCGPKMDYVKDVKGDSEVVHISVFLYIPLIGRFFSPNVTAKTPRLNAFALAGDDLLRTNPNAKVFIPLPSTCL